MNRFLPISREEIAERGWEQLDFLFISGDAYVDHPSFGPAVICRVLEAQGYKVALLCQPAWDKPEDFAELGKPRLGVLISGGNLDSISSLYVAVVDDIAAFHAAGHGAVNDDGAHQVAHIGRFATSGIYTYAHLAQLGQQFVGTVDNGGDYFAWNQQLVTANGR